MSYFDPTMLNDPTPIGWEKYRIHCEVNENDIESIKYLEKEGWVYFANGGSISGDPTMGINYDCATRWYGLKYDIIVNLCGK